MADDYEVGYGKPPDQSKFKPGQSGNPRGRPRKHQTDTVDVAAILDRPVTVRRKGRQRKMGAFEASLRGLVKRALTKHDLRAAIEFLRLAEKYKIIVPAPPPEQGGVFVVPMGYTPQEYLERFAEVRTTPEGREQYYLPDRSDD